MCNRSRAANMQMAEQAESPSGIEYWEVVAEMTETVGETGTGSSSFLTTSTLCRRVALDRLILGPGAWLFRRIILRWQSGLDWKGLFPGRAPGRQFPPRDMYYLFILCSVNGDTGSDMASLTRIRLLEQRAEKASSDGRSLRASEARRVRQRQRREQAEAAAEYVASQANAHSVTQQLPAKREEAARRQDGLPRVDKLLLRYRQQVKNYNDLLRVDPNSAVFKASRAKAEALIRSLEASKTEAEAEAEEGAARTAEDAAPEDGPEQDPDAWRTWKPGQDLSKLEGILSPEEMEQIRESERQRKAKAQEQTEAQEKLDEELAARRKPRRRAKRAGPPSTAVLDTETRQLFRAPLVL